MDANNILLRWRRECSIKEQVVKAGKRRYAQKKGDRENQVRISSTNKLTAMLRVDDSNGWCGHEAIYVVTPVPAPDDKKLVQVKQEILQVKNFLFIDIQN